MSATDLNTSNVPDFSPAALPVVLPGDFAPGFTSADARAGFDDIAEMARQLVEIFQNNPKGITGAAHVEAGVLARLIGLKSDGTAGDVGADLNAAWGIVVVN